MSKIFGNTLVWNKKKEDYEEKPMYSAEKLSKYKQGFAFVKSQGKNPYHIKFLGYKDYPFYREPVSQKELVSSDLPSVKLLNIKELVLQ